MEADASIIDFLDIIGPILSLARNSSGPSDGLLLGMAGVILRNEYF